MYMRVCVLVPLTVHERSVYCETAHAKGYGVIVPEARFTAGTEAGCNRIHPRPEAESQARNQCRHALALAARQAKRLSGPQVDQPPALFSCGCRYGLAR